MRRLSPKARVDRWKSFAGRRRNEERGLRQKLGSVFDDLADEVIANLEAFYRGASALVVKAPQIEAMLFTDEGAGAAFSDVVLPFVTGVALRTGREAIASLGADIMFNPDTSRMQEIIRERRRFMKSVGSKAQRDCRNSLAAGVAEGENVEYLKRRVLQWAKKEKARYAPAVARTEVGIAMNAAAKEGYSQAGASHKEWLAIVDDNTRGADPKDSTDHVSMDGVIVPMDGAFELESDMGIEYADAPMDPSLSAANIVNCRCAMAAVFEG